MSRNVALVLSSGGARGIAHIGVIEELTKAGYTITSVAGTSMGSVVGGMLAKGSLPAFTEWLLSFTKMDVIKLMDITTGHGGLIKGEKVMKTLADLIGDINIEELSIPYSCVAADLISHKEVVFTHGSLLQAIRASSSIPTVLLPVSVDGQLLVDGGILNPLPIDLVHRSLNDILVVVNVNANIPPQSKPFKKTNTDQENYYNKLKESLNEKWSEVIDHYVEKHRKNAKAKPVKMFDVISETINLVHNKLANLSIEKYKPEVVVNISFKSASVFDFYKSEDLIEMGRMACKQALAEYQLRISEPKTVVQ